MPRLRYPENDGHQCHGYADPRGMAEGISWVAGVVIGSVAQATFFAEL